MKRIIRLFIILTALFVTTNVYAASANISANKTNIYVGDTATITVSVYAGAWNLKLTGTMSDTIVGYDQDGNKQTTKVYSFTPTSTGSYTFKLSGDFTDYDTEYKTPDYSKSVTITVTERPVTPTTTTKPRTTTKRTTQDPVVAPTPEETTTVPVEETTTVAIENPITNIRVVGYDIQFDKNKTEYEINVSKYVDSVYIIVEGDNLESASPGIVDIKDKDSIDVTLPVGDKTYKYTIKINRLTYGDTAEANNIIKGLTATLIIMCLVMAVIVSISVIAIVSLKKKAQDHTIKPINDNYTQNM